MFLAYSNWRGGQPDSMDTGTEQLCVKLGKDGRWEDIACSEVLTAACQFGAEMLIATFCILKIY